LTLISYDCISNDRITVDYSHWYLNTMLGAGTTSNTQTAKYVKMDILGTLPHCND